MPETPALQSMIEGCHHMGRKPVVLLPGLICNEREPEPKTQLQSICARLSDDCDPAAGCLQVITARDIVEHELADENSVYPRLSSILSGSGANGKSGAYSPRTHLLRKRTRM